MSTSTESSPADGVPPPVDRAAAFKAGPQRVPLKVVIIALAVGAALTLLGILGEDLFSKAGLNPLPPKPAPVVAPPTVPSGIPQLGAPLRAFLGLKALSPRPAPAFGLVDESGRRVTLAGEHGKVVVLSFFNGSCTDICRVLAAEILRADRDLGPAAAKVVFLSVNTDPLAGSVGPATPAVSETPLSRLANWHMLGGSLAELNGVWRDYGVTVYVYPHGLVTHNDVMYFIDAQGRLRYRVIPYANEDRSGLSSLPAADLARWGTGIALYARRLLPARKS